MNFNPYYFSCAGCTYQFGGDQPGGVDVGVDVGVGQGDESFTFCREPVKLSYRKCLWRDFTGYEVGERLGAGAYGIVHQACLKDDCNYAVKIVFPEDDDDDDDDWSRSRSRSLRGEIDRDFLEDFYKEIEISKVMSKNGISPKFYGGWICNQENVGVMVFEKYQISLEDYLKNYEKDEDVYDTTRLPRDILLHVFTEVNKMIQMIHGLGYSHTDLHLGNIMLKFDGGGMPSVRIIDWGLADSIRKMSDIRGMIEHAISTTSPMGRRSLGKQSVPFEEFLRKKYRNKFRKVIRRSPQLIDYATVYYWNDFLRIPQPF